MGDYDKHLTVFSSDGRIYQVEYSFKAVLSVGLNAVAVRGTDCCVVCTQKKIPDTMIDPDSVTQLYKVTDRIGCCVIGLPTDCREIVTTLRKEAYDYQFDFGYEVPVKQLAQRLGDIHQGWTQNTGMRLRAVVSFLIGIDEEKGPQLFKVDPAGLVQGYKAAITGPKEQEGTNYLEKQFKKKEEYSKDEAIQQTIACLQQITSNDFKASDVEIGILTNDNTEFRKLTSSEIEEHLNILADRD